MARRDRPASESGVVRDDPMPLEGEDVVHLVVEQPLLELPDGPPTLLPIGRAALPLVELVERAIGVAAVVHVADVRRLELEERQVRLDDIAAMEVRRDVEISPADLVVERRELERLDLHIEPDLAPLVDEPDSEWLVRVADRPVAEREREPLGHARFLQKTPRLGPRGAAVTAVARQPLQLRRPRGG